MTSDLSTAVDNHLVTNGDNHNIWGNFEVMIPHIASKSPIDNNPKQSAVNLGFALIFHKKLTLFCAKFYCYFFIFLFSPYFLSQVIAYL